MLLRSLFFATMLWVSLASRPPMKERVLRRVTALDCLQPGTWGNDWPVCEQAVISNKSKTKLDKRLAQELKLKLREDGTGEMNFYFCQTKQRITSSIRFNYRVEKDQLKMNWQGSGYDVWLASQTFNRKNSFTVRCSQDTLFIDSLMQSTVYRGATYFLRRD